MSTSTSEYLKISIPVAAGSPFGSEGVWVIPQQACTGHVVSVVRYGGPCQAGDLICYNAAGKYVEVLQAAGALLHCIFGAHTAHGVSMELMARLHKRGLLFEVWTETLAFPEGTKNRFDTEPLCAGLAVPPGELAHRAAESLLQQAARELGLALWAPTLMEACGDELGAARHRKALRSLGTSKPTGHRGRG